MANIVQVLSRCLTTRIIVLDQASLATLQIFYSIINIHHVDYLKLIWDGTHRKPSIHRTPNPKRIQNKNGEQASVESSATLLKLKFKIQPQQPNPFIPVPTYTKIERDQLTKAQQVRLAKAESDKEDEARENIKLVKEYVLAEEVDKLVEGEE
ncbi:hypothetical protein Tco_0370355 [Tanacetum coccineum]